MIGDILRGGSTLSRLTRDLTADARAGKLEPVRCRDDEIARVIDILLRQGKNNPALVGAAGIGKTAIAEGLAQRIAAGEVPLVLRSARLLALDHVTLLGGTMYRGQYEERIGALVAEASSDPDIILFIDELHNLIGQGTAIGVAMDAANMLKPALVRGEFRVIGATTSDEYDRWVCGDPALERRFQKVAVRELSPEQTLEILQARKERLERHHNVVVAEEALRAAVELTDRYITDRARPDRAIDAIDEACAHAQAGATYSRHTEALIVERRDLLRMPQHQPDDGPADMRGDTGAAAHEDPFERLAREGISVLERFGAELEATLSGQRRPGSASRTDVPPAAPADRTATSTSTASTPRATRSERLAAVESELHRRLIEEGLVVRGHDVARVIAVATGYVVSWPA
jgi:ATP-dependent Clp protease ATP-binding subunit ClpA